MAAHPHAVATDRDVHLLSLSREEACHVRYRRDAGKFVVSLAEAELQPGWASQSLVGRLLARWWPCLFQYWRRRAQAGDEPWTLERFFSEFDLATIAHLRWALYYLLLYQPAPEAGGLARLRGYLLAFEHLVALPAWEEAGLLLTLKPAGSDQPLHQLLHAGGYWPEAIALYEPLLGRGAPSLEALCLAGLGDCYSKLGDRQRAIDYSQRYLALPPATSRRQERVRVLYTLASNCEAVGATTAAREAWQQYLVASRTQQQADLAALPALLALGRLYEDSEPARARDYWQQAATLATAAQRPQEQGAACLGLGRCQYALGDYGAAIASLQDCLAVVAAAGHDSASERQEAARAYLYLGGSYWALGDYEMAIAQLQQCLERAAALRGDLVQVLFFLGSAHYNRQEYPAAIAYLEQYLQQAPASEAPVPLEQRALSELGQAHAALHQYRPAIAALQRYLESVEAHGEPQDLSQTFFTLGQAYHAEQDYPAAIEALEHYLALLTAAPAPPEAVVLQQVYFALGTAYLAQRAFADAIRYLDQYAVLAPHDAVVYLALGQAHCGQGHWPTAIANLRTYLQETSLPEARAWFYLGYARHASGDWAQSQSDLRRYTQMAPEQQNPLELAEAYYCLGAMAYRQQDYAQAVADWQRFLQRRAVSLAGGHLPAAGRDQVDSLEAAAPAWVARDPWQEATPGLPLPAGEATAMPWGQRQGQVLLELGRAYTHLGEFDRALACWQELLKQGGGPEGREAALFELGGVQEILGRYDEAIAAYEQALTLANERGDGAGTGRATGRIGRVHYYRGHYDKALALLHKYLRGARQDRDRRLEGAILSDIGRVYAAQGDGDRALSLQQQALNLAQDHDDERGVAVALTYLGAVYGDLGNYTQAVKHLQQSLLLAQQQQARLLQGDIFLYLGHNQTLLEEYTAASEALQMALNLARSLRARRLQALVLGASTRLYQALGNYERAQADCEQALAIATELGLPEAEAWAALQGQLTPSVLSVLWELLRSFWPRPRLAVQLEAASPEPHRSA